MNTLNWSLDNSQLVYPIFEEIKKYQTKATFKTKRHRRDLNPKLPCFS